MTQSRMHEPGDAAPTAGGPLPAQACDSHLHIYAATWAPAADAPAVEGAFAACTDEAYARRLRSLA